MQTINIIDAPHHVNERVKIGVWLTDKRSSGKIAFLQLRDGTAFFQGVLLKNKVTPEVFELAKHELRQEASFWVIGEIHEDTRSKFGYEIQIEDIEVIDASEDYPIGNKEHGIDFLLDNRHLWLRSSKPQAMMKIRDRVIRANYEYFGDHGFTKIDPPILTGNAPEGTTDLFHTKYFEQDAYLSQSGQLYEEAGALALNKVYSFGPVFRAEKSKTRRHLIEFWMIEPEMAFMHQEGSLEIQEKYVAFLVQAVLDNCDYALTILGRDKEVLKEYTKLPYPRISYDEAIKLLQESGEFPDVKWGEDFGSPEETYLANHFSKPVFVMNYPKAIKPFYMKPHPTRDDVVVCADLLAPEGYGEIIGGSERAVDPAYLEAQIKQAGLDVADYEWYLDLRRFGSVPHSGFGLGLERAVTWITGESHIREAIPFPRLLNRIYP